MMNIKRQVFLSAAIFIILTVQLLLVRWVASQTIATYHPTEYNLHGSTTHVNGTISSLQSQDSEGVGFRSYFSGVDTLDFIDNNTSDIDSSLSKGVHSNFAAQQAGPDMIYDTLMEEDTDIASNITSNFELDLEAQWINLNYSEINGELAIYIDKGSNVYSLDATGGYMIIGDGTPDWGSTAGTISFWIRMDNAVQGRLWGQNGYMETRWLGANLVLDWGATGSLISAYSFLADTWYFIAIVWNENSNDLFLYIGDESNPPILDENSLDGTWTSTLPAPMENRFMNGLGAYDPVDGRGDDLRYWNIARSLNELQSDYNTELAGDETNLKSYFKLNSNFDDLGPDNNDGAGSGSYRFSSNVAFDRPPAESLKVDVWDGSSWQNLLTDLFKGWNNVSVSSFLDSPIFTIRFKGGTETGDSTQDRWLVDVVLLYIWSNEYTVDVEFSGSSNLETWEHLNWSIACAWTIDLVNVTLQLFNYSLGDYSINKNGQISYVSSLANADEVKGQSVKVNAKDFQNNSGYWRLRIKGVKSTVSQFDLKVDMVQYEILTVPSNPFSWGNAIQFALIILGVLFPLAVLLKWKRKESKDASSALTFSDQFSMAHSDITGRKILLQVDPTSDYYKVLFNFVSEARANDELLFIFTSMNSILHTEFSKNKDTKFFLSTSKTSSPQKISDTEILTPANDLSVLLDAFARAQKAEKTRNISILFDNLSDTILMCGFEKTYKFLRFLFETISSEKATALFLFNPTAHDPATASSVRGLFHIQLNYPKNRETKISAMKFV